MNLYIPTIGDEIVLEQDWYFDVHYEERNASLYSHLGYQDIALSFEYWANRKKHVPTLRGMFPAGTTLKIERIYIRKGQEKFDSITFLIPGVKVEVPFTKRDYPKVNGKIDYSQSPIETIDTKSRPLRFWVKLPDANTIQFKPK